MFITLEINFFLFINLFFFVTVFLSNYTKLTGNFTSSYWLFLIFAVDLVLTCFFFPLNYSYINNFISAEVVHYTYKFSFVALYTTFLTFCYFSYSQTFRPEIFYFYNLSCSAGMFLASTQDFILAFILLELSSIPMYVLVASTRNRYAIEAALKYLIFGSLASQLFILSYTFFTISTNSNNPTDTLFFLAFLPDFDETFKLFFFLSIFIKFGVGPFYNWLIDVYHASSYPIFVFNSTIAKLIAFFPLSNFGLYFGISDSYNIFFVTLLLYSTIHSTINLYFQNNFRRIFGYSSVINYSFFMISFFLGPSHNYAAYQLFKYMVFYNVILLLVYASFEIYRAIDEKNMEPKSLDDVVSYSMTNFPFIIGIIFSSGLPPAGIFYAKSYIYGVIIGAALPFNFFVSIILALFSVLGLFGYFRIIAKAYSFISSTRFRISKRPTYTLVAFNIFLIFTLVIFSIYWEKFMSF